LLPYKIELQTCERETAHAREREQQPNQWPRENKEKMGEGRKERRREGRGGEREEQRIRRV